MSEREQAYETLHKEYLPEMKALSEQEGALAAELDRIRCKMRDLRDAFEERLSSIEKYYDALDVIQSTPDEVKKLGSKDVQP